MTARTGYTKYSGALYDADGVRVNASTTYFFGGSEKTLYNGNGSYVYGRGDSVSAIDYSGTLYESGGNETVTVITEEYDGLLYKAGTRTSIMQQGDVYKGTVFNQDPNNYSGGLYYNPKLATISTREVTALTV